MVKLWRCEICGDPYIGNVQPAQCAFCGAHARFIKEAVTLVDKDLFDVALTDKDKKNIEEALSLEISNSAFYACAANRTDDKEGQELFRALAKIEAEHASIWRRILKLDKEDIEKGDSCSPVNNDNLKESHEREEKAITFYIEAGESADSERVKEIFHALVEVEKDHLKLSEQRLK